MSESLEDKITRLEAAMGELQDINMTLMYSVPDYVGSPYQITIQERIEFTSILLSDAMMKRKAKPSHLKVVK